MPTPSFGLSIANRWFAVEFNNRAWDLIEAATRTDDETAEMISTSHASCVHWRSAGGPINHLRGQCLLAMAYSAAGFGEPAVWHATKCLGMSEKLGNELSPFDCATVRGCAANAYSSSGDANRASEQYGKLTEVLRTIDDSDDKALLLKLYPPPKSK